MRQSSLGTWVRARAIYLVTALAAFAGVSTGQGFTTRIGTGKQFATLRRLLPATVNLNGKRIKIEPKDLTGQARHNQPGQGISPGDLTILKTKLITAIQKDNRFVESETNPETILQFTITEYYIDKIGWTASGNSGACEAYIGKMEVSYQAIEPVTKVALDSENLSEAIERNPQKTVNGVTGVLHKESACGTQAAESPSQARDELMDSIVRQMARRAAPTEEVVQALVPRGKLEALSAMAESSRWATLLEEAEKADKLPKPADDAYRLYLIGLANEGLAYDKAHDAAEKEKTRRNDMTSPAALQSIAEEDKDYAAAQNYIDNAAKSYKDAIQGNPTEKGFREPDARIEHAVKLYATIMRHKEEYRQAVLKKQKSAPPVHRLRPKRPRRWPIPGAVIRARARVRVRYRRPPRRPPSIRFCRCASRTCRA